MIIDKINSFFIGTAHAVEGSSFWGIFDPVGETIGGLDAESTTKDLIGLIVTWLLAIAAVVAFVYLVMSGINYITAGGDSEKATKARSGILNAIIGIVVIVLAYVIMRFAIGLGDTIKTGVGA